MPWIQRRWLVISQGLFVFSVSGGEISAPLFLQSPQVVDIMRVNVDKVLERDQKLSELDDRADALQAGASQFESSAAKLKRKYWWKNCKVRFPALSSFSCLAPLSGGKRSISFPLKSGSLLDMYYLY